MFKQYFAIILFVITGICNYSNAQSTDKISAKDYLGYEDYNRALIEYLKLYKANKEDIDLNIKIGFCYLHINDDKTKAIPYLEYAYNKGGYKDELLLYLGVAYMHAYRFNEAIKFFNNYKGKIKIKDQDLINHYIENCESAKLFIENPVNVTFENLGKNINSKYPDYNPFVTKDQGTLYFTSDRETSKKSIQSSQGYFTSDIYFSKVVEGEWTKAKSIGNSINTPEDEQCVYVTPDGKNMIIAVDNEFAVEDLFTTTSVKDGQFPAPVPFDLPVNTKRIELEGSITEDGNTLIISSNRKGGFGEMDLYMFKKLPNGQWGLPINLGPNINTKYQEAFPRYDEKNNILYFSSEGHMNMGGYDIFKSKFDSITQTFGQAVNMGYPINTPEDNMQFTVAGNKRDGYISAYRKEGLGDLDIYKLIFNDIEIRISVIKGIVTVKDTLNKNIDATVSLFNNKTNKNVEAKKANQKSGKYVFAVEPGKYLLNVSSPGFQKYNQEIIIYDKSDSDFVFEIERNVILQKQEPAPNEDNKSPLITADTIINKKIVTNNIIKIKDSTTQDQKLVNELVYRIQIGVFQNPISKNAFKGLSAVYTETYSGGTKYFKGAFFDYANAQHEKEYIKSIGLTDAFIVAYYNKKRITIEEARSFENKK